MNYSNILRFLISRSRNEAIQTEALKEYYKKIDATNKNKKRIIFFKKFSKVYYPFFCVVFVVTFWTFGLKNYYEA